MRSWAAPEPADILVSELLGSFGDNELSPECLDGAARFLRPGGLSIPAAYTSYLQPVTASKLWADVKVRVVGLGLGAGLGLRWRIHPSTWLAQPGGAACAHAACPCCMRLAASAAGRGWHSCATALAAACAGVCTTKHPTPPPPPAAPAASVRARASERCMCAARAVTAGARTPPKGGRGTLPYPIRLGAGVQRPRAPGDAVRCAPAPLHAASGHAAGVRVRAPRASRGRRRRAAGQHARGAAALRAAGRAGCRLPRLCRLLRRAGAPAPAAPRPAS